MTTILPTPSSSSNITKEEEEDAVEVIPAEDETKSAAEVALRPNRPETLLENHLRPTETTVSNGNITSNSSSVTTTTIRTGRRSIGTSLCTTIDNRHRQVSFIFVFMQLNYLLVIEFQEPILL